MTPAQVAAWDAASVQERALWLMTSQQRKAWDHASPDQRNTWIAAWTSPLVEMEESWWRIGLPV